jgi:fatty acid desaturase
MMLDGESVTQEPRNMREKYPIPNRINLIGLMVASASVIALLVLASSAIRSSQWWLFAVYVSLFGFINNTNFSFFHEAVHGILHSNRRLNEVLGIWAGAFFPTSFTLQQYFHLGHHCRNRTDAEMFDLYYPGDNLWVKRLVIYAMPTGFYWMSAVLANVLFLFLPWLLRWNWLRSTSLMKHSGFDSMLAGIPDTQRMLAKIRFQIVCWLAIQLTLIIIFQIHLAAWLACYWLFGMIWGSLQYTDHAFSPRDIRHGAWNLKVDPITRWVFLNYHFHLVHHLYPSLPWIYLPKFVTKDEIRPTGWRNFWKLMCGPVETNEPAPVANREFKNVIYEGTSMAAASPNNLVTKPTQGV